MHKTDKWHCEPVFNYCYTTKVVTGECPDEICYYRAGWSNNSNGMHIDVFPGCFPIEDRLSRNPIISILVFDSFLIIGIIIFIIGFIYTLVGYIKIARNKKHNIQKLHGERIKKRGKKLILIGLSLSLIILGILLYINLYTGW